MKILYTSNLYAPSIGGAQIHLHRLAQAMQQLGNEVRVVTHSCRHRTDWLRFSTICTEENMNFTYQGIPVWQLGFSRSTRIRLLPWTLAYYGMIGPAVRGISREVRRLLDVELDKPDVVHGIRIGREFLSRATVDFAHKHQVPFIFTPNHHPRWRGYRYSEYDKIYREADALFVLTEEEKRTMVVEKGVKEENIHVTGVGPVLSAKFDAQLFRSTFDIPNRFVLFVGQQFRYKGGAALLQAAPLVWRSHPDVTFVFVGPHTDYSRRLFAGINDRRVRNLGQVDLETKTAALAECEFLCLPSNQESFGGVFVEAWSLGKAVVGGRIPPIAALISEGQDGLLSSQEPPELADSISLLLSSPQERERMGAMGMKKVRANYTWDRIAAKTAGVYNDLLGTQADDHRLANVVLLQDVQNNGAAEKLSA